MRRASSASRPIGAWWPQDGGADLILLDADPLADIRNVRQVRAVVLNGRLLRREDLAARTEALQGGPRKTP